MRFFNVLRKTAKLSPVAANPDQMDKNGYDFWTQHPPKPLQTSRAQKSCIPVYLNARMCLFVVFFFLRVFIAY